jgi:hypothetical protein
VDSAHVDERPHRFEIQNCADGRLPMLTVTGYWDEWDYRLDYTMTFRVTAVTKSSPGVDAAWFVNRSSRQMINGKLIAKLGNGKLVEHDERSLL